MTAMPLEDDPDAGRLAARVERSRRRLTLTRDGEPVAVVISAEELSGLEDTVEMLRNPTEAAEPGDVHAVDRSRVVVRRNTEAPEGWFVLVAHPVATPDPAVAAGIERTAAGWDALWTLCGGYLHQDFDVHGGVDGAVGAFEAEALDAQRGAAAAALRRLLADGDDAYLAAATEWLGLDYHPAGDGHTLRGWLTTLAGRLES